MNHKDNHNMLKKETKLYDKKKLCIKDFIKQKQLN